MSPTPPLNRIVYDDEDTEWVNLTRESERVVVDDGILGITDAMKSHLGIPLDGVRDAVSDVTVCERRGRPARAQYL